MNLNNSGNNSKNRQMGLHQINKRLHSKINNRVKIEDTEWEKTISTYLSNWGLMSRIYKELKKLNTKGTSNQINKWVNELNRYFPKGVQMANK
jgi:hypothetical protein